MRSATTLHGRARPSRPTLPRQLPPSPESSPRPRTRLLAAGTTEKWPFRTSPNQASSQSQRPRPPTRALLLPDAPQKRPPKRHRPGRRFERGRLHLPRRPCLDPARFRRRALRVRQRRRTPRPPRRRTPPRRSPASNLVRACAAPRCVSSIEPLQLECASSWRRGRLCFGAQRRRRRIGPFVCRRAPSCKQQPQAAPSLSTFGGCDLLPKRVRSCRRRLCPLKRPPTAQRSRPFAFPDGGAPPLSLPRRPSRRRRRAQTTWRRGKPRPATSVEPTHKSRSSRPFRGRIKFPPRQHGEGPFEEHQNVPNGRSKGQRPLERPNAPRLEAKDRPKGRSLGKAGI
mmetsp:Transcript_22982/g.77651  ORF Transcript_22982/g.77651 Transcript_22982/m.77651 type:complete len:341 (+) Transcript_22982:702-1724(+)